jgi:hypothetical protein
VPLVGDVAIQGDAIAAVGSLGRERGRTEIDATGLVHVFVNGTQVLKDGEHMGAKPGRVVRGPGWLGSDQ